MPIGARFSVGVACLLAFGSGCSYKVFSPPARAFHLESAAPVKPGETMVGARGGVFGGSFEPAAIVGSGGVRHGIAPKIELNAEGTYARIADDDGQSSKVEKNAGAVHLGMKAGNGYAAAIVGAGAGVTALGAFTAVDTGAIFSYPNCYVVPFLSPTGFVSVPGGAKKLTFDNGRTSKAGTAFGFGASAGLEVLLDRARCREGRTSARLQLGMNLQYVWGRNTSAEGPDVAEVTATTPHGFVGFGLGFEIPLAI